MNSLVSYHDFYSPEINKALIPFNKSVILSGNIFLLNVFQPLHYMAVEKPDIRVGGASFSGEHISVPLIGAVLKGDHGQVFLFHIVKNKIHCYRNPLILLDHFVAEAEAAGFKDNVRFKSCLTAFFQDQTVDMKFRAFDIKPFPFQIFDTVALAILNGQMLGRWGNFFNREAFGEYTDSLFAMRLPLDAVRSGDVTETMRRNIETIGGVEYIQVHPTFLYESVWCAVLLILLVDCARTSSCSRGSGSRYPSSLQG